MKTEFLKALGIEDDAIAKIMAENGKDIESTKSKFSDYDSLKTQLTERDKDIEALKASKGDTEALNKQITDLQAKYTADTEKLAKEKADMQFNHLLDGALTGAKAKNPKAVKALLDQEGLKLNGEEIVGLKEQLEKIKSENDYLFETGEANPTFTKNTGTGAPALDALASMKAAMGLPTETK